MKKNQNLEGLFINTYYGDDGVECNIACWILNGRFYNQIYDAKTDELHKIKRISGREYQSQYEYHYNL